MCERRTEPALAWDALTVVHCTGIRATVHLVPSYTAAQVMDGGPRPYPPCEQQPSPTAGVGGKGGGQGSWSVCGLSGDFRRVALPG